MHICFQRTVTIVFPKVLVLIGKCSLVDKLIAVANNTVHPDLRTLHSLLLICVGTLHFWRSSKQWILNSSNSVLFL